MSQHTERFLDGFWTLFITGLIIAASVAIVFLGIFIIQYWYYTQWVVYTLITVAACYLLGWLIEVTS